MHICRQTNFGGGHALRFCEHDARKNKSSGWRVSQYQIFMTMPGTSGSLRLKLWIPDSSVYLPSSLKDRSQTIRATDLDAGCHFIKSLAPDFPGRKHGGHNHVSCMPFFYRKLVRQKSSNDSPKQHHQRVKSYQAKKLLPSFTLVYPVTIFQKHHVICTSTDQQWPATHHAMIRQTAQG